MIQKQLGILPTVLRYVEMGDAITWVHHASGKDQSTDDNQDEKKKHEPGQCWLYLHGAKIEVLTRIKPQIVGQS